MKKIFYLLLVVTFPISAQSPFTFGDISMHDMEMTRYELDKDAPAVFLFDWCSAELNVQNNLNLEVKRHFRIKILKQEGLDQAIFHIRAGGHSPMGHFKANTYNLEDGKIITSPLTKKDLFKEISNNTITYRFAFSNVKVGSIIEGTYTVNYESYFFLYPWAFQRDIPVAYSEYNIAYPGLFRYKTDPSFGALDVMVTQDMTDLYLGSIKTVLQKMKFKTSNVPAFKPEPYMGAKADLISKVEFELAGIDYPNYGYDEITPSYEKLSEKLLNNENFGTPIKTKPYLLKLVHKITEGKTSSLEKIKAIHAYITKNVKWNEETGIYATKTNFRRVLQEQTGSSADINLLFVALMEAANITSCPVVLSTRDNGSLNPFFAIVTKFDYVIAYAKIDDKEYLMDATDELRPFNQLPAACLNGSGRTIHPRMSKWITLSNKETDFNQVIMNADLVNENELQCHVQRLFGGFSAYDMRKVLQETGKDGFVSLLKLNGGNKEYSNMEIQNQDSIGKMLIINYDVRIKGEVQTTSELSIINPVLMFASSENPFLSAKRNFPIEFNYSENEIYTIKLNIPPDYELDELPNDLIMRLDDKTASLTYQPMVNDQQLTLNYRLVRSGTYYPVEMYEGIKAFYAKYMNKQSDLILLRKKTSPHSTEAISAK